MSKLHSKNAHKNYYEGWGSLGDDGNCDYYIKVTSKRDKLLSIVMSDDPEDYLSPDYNVLTANLSRFWYTSPEYRELIKRLTQYGHLSSNKVVDQKVDKNTGKVFQLRTDGCVYIDLGCGWFESLFTQETDFYRM